MALIGFTASLNNEMCFVENGIFDEKIYHHNSTHSFSISQIVCTPDLTEGAIGTLILIGLITILAFAIMVILYSIVEYRRHLNIENHIKVFSDLETNDKGKLLIRYLVLSVLITIPTIIIILAYTTGTFLGYLLPEDTVNKITNPNDPAASFLITKFGYAAFTMFAFASLWIFLLRILRKSFRNDLDLEKKKQYPGKDAFVKYFYSAYVLSLPALMFPESFPLKLYHYTLDGGGAVLIIALLAIVAGTVIFSMEQLLVRHMKHNQSSSS
jgi:hypothetical protein